MPPEQVTSVTTSAQPFVLDPDADDVCDVTDPDDVADDVVEPVELRLPDVALDSLPPPEEPNEPSDPLPPPLPEVTDDCCDTCDPDDVDDDRDDDCEPDEPDSEELDAAVLLPFEELGTLPLLLPPD